MEDKLLELLRNFYPTETFDGRNAPTTQRIQELIRRGYKEGKNRAFYVAFDEYVSMAATTRRFLPSV